MAWLQKRPQVSDPTNFYTVGLNKTILMVGLGNPGKDYDSSRHNIGFDCLDYFVQKNTEMGQWIIKKDLKSILSTGQIGDTRVLAVKPTTFMNLSGEAVQAVLHFYKLSAGQVIVVHDELDIDFGQIRLRNDGSSAGHNGIKSISNVLGEDYARIRVGIGPKKPARIKSEDFVLQKFSDSEKSQMTNLFKEAGSILSEFVFGTGIPNETRSFMV
jgi:PTH1 family peptidyl-tRNA hydrolase